MLSKIKILEVGITNEREKEILKFFKKSFKGVQKKIFLVTPNPEILVYAHKHPEYKELLNKADVALPDGVGVFLASLLRGKPFKERLPGVDFIETVCKYSRRNPMSIGFLGGKEGVANHAAECLLEKYPWINIRWVGEEWENSQKRTKKSENDTDGSGSIPSLSPYISNADPIDILFVAFGFPKQEKWIYENLHKLPVRAAMGVGGAFDYLSGEVIRAPYLIRAVGFEWLFRLIRQPWRFKRQLALIEFMMLVLKERFSS